MKEKKRISIPLKHENQIKSLCWVDDYLLDFVGGNVGISLDGGITDPRVNFGYRFDSAISTPDGIYSVIYERFGTKALLLHRGQLVRELSRSYYCANAYEYPICFLDLGKGAYGIAHCPDNYNIIEIEEAETGKRLTKDDRKPVDFFQSRLEVSPNQKWLLSAGWIWHPLDSILIYDLTSGLDDPKVYSPFWDGNLGDIGLWEINNATFISDSILLLSGTGDQEAEDGSSEIAIVVFDLEEKKIIARKSVSNPTGKLMALSSEYAIGFYQHPKIIDISTSEIIRSWNDIPTDERNSSINFLNSQSIIATDAKNARFAVATPNTIEVVTLD